MPSIPVAPAVQHRSLRSFSLSPGRLACVVLLPASFNVATWWTRDLVARWWAAFFAFWIDKLGLAGSVTIRSVGPAWMDVALPHVELPTVTPGLTGWAATFWATAALVLVSRRLPDSMLPLAHFLRFTAFIQGTALLYFAVPGSRFPYSVPEYLGSTLATSAWLLGFVPWLHAVVYYLLDYSLARKVGLTLLTLAFLVVAVPCQLMVHAYVLARGTLLVMPLLYLVCGMSLLIFDCVALYGFAMSWRRLPDPAPLDAWSFPRSPGHA